VGSCMNNTNRKFRIDEWIAAILLFAMATIAFVNVLSRYFFHFSFAATEEVTINFFVWLTLLGSGIAFERGSQLGMIQTIYTEITLFHSTSAALGIPIVFYYIGVPLLSVFVFIGIYREASRKMKELDPRGQ
jgi:TRAP-type C4-dicarboxylate transport system permease small subunit